MTTPTKHRSTPPNARVVIYLPPDLKWRIAQAALDRSRASGSFVAATELIRETLLAEFGDKAKVRHA